MSRLPVSDEVARHEAKLQLQDEVRWRATGRRGPRPKRTGSLTLAEIDRQLVALGFGWVLAEVDR